MKEMSLSVSWGRYINGKLNPNRIEAVYVRGKSVADCARLISAHTRSRNITAYHLNTYAHDSWGNYRTRPKHTGRGVWITRDTSDKEMVEVWIDSLPNVDVLAPAGEKTPNP